MFSGRCRLEVSLRSQGYLLLATGPAKYMEMARNLAASIRVMDGTRPICLVHDEGSKLTAGDARLFDDEAILPEDSRYGGLMNKARLFEASPYDRTMFVDADCLLVKRDIDVYWEMAAPYPFAITGVRRTQGQWKGVDIATLLKQEGAPYLVQMNSGVFCFERSNTVDCFFRGLDDFYLRRRQSLEIANSRDGRIHSHELYLGLWMGLNRLDSCGGKYGENSWMVSTWRSFGIAADPEKGTSIIRKPRRSVAGVPVPIGGWDRLSPSFLHFIGLKPAPLYARLSQFFMSKVERTAPRRNVSENEPFPSLLEASRATRGGTSQSPLDRMTDSFGSPPQPDRSEAALTQSVTRMQSVQSRAGVA